VVEARSEPAREVRAGDGKQVITRYATVAVVLHWLIAALLVINIALAWSRGFITREKSGVVMDIHKSTGILILLLSLVRLGWRLAHPAPPYPAGLPAWERGLAHVTQWGFYLVMIAMPLTGWVMTSGPRAHGPLTLYGLLP
jgi:cytochrome b561